MPFDSIMSLHELLSSHSDSANASSVQTTLVIPQTKLTSESYEDDVDVTVRTLPKPPRTPKTPKSPRKTSSGVDSPINLSCSKYKRFPEASLDVVGREFAAMNSPRSLDTRNIDHSPKYDFVKHTYVRAATVPVSVSYSWFCLCLCGCVLANDTLGLNDMIALPEVL